MDLKQREIVVGVTGGIAAYKSAEIVSRLRHLGASVHVIMTRNATQFVSPLTFQTLSANPVVTDTFAVPESWHVGHVALAQRAELFVIAPATANILAKMACGLADDMLSTTVLATRAPILVAPAMNTGMWTAEATQQNMAVLRKRGVHVVGPDSGVLACGDQGAGRMAEPEEIVARIQKLLSRGDFAGRSVLVTAGGTKERLDPVRYLTNDSSGRMGIALAEAARDRGANVTLLYGSISVPLPDGVRPVHFESTMDLYDGMLAAAGSQDLIIQAAAPGDYRFAEVSGQKIKKQDGKPLSLELVENPDVAKAVGQAKHAGQILIGFAAETEHLTENALGKLARKNLDMIVANDVTQEGAGFNTDTNIVTLITREGEESIPLMPKRELADLILDRALALWERNR